MRTTSTGRPRRTGSPAWEGTSPTSTMRRCGRTSSAGQEPSRKNWNSNGDHIPAYLVNLILALDPLPKDADEDLRRFLDECVTLLETTSRLILEKFPDPESALRQRAVPPQLEAGPRVGVAAGSGDLRAQLQDRLEPDAGRQVLPQPRQPDLQRRPQSAAGRSRPAVRRRTDRVRQETRPVHGRARDRPGLRRPL